MHDVRRLGGLFSGVGEGGATRRGMKTNRGGREQVVVDLEKRIERQIQGHQLALITIKLNIGESCRPKRSKYLVCSKELLRVNTNHYAPGLLSRT